VHYEWSAQKNTPASPTRSEIEFRYDSQRDDCVNLRGQSGLNHGYLGECGEVSELNLRSTVLQGKVFNGIRATHVNWEGADLRGASFKGAWIVSSSFKDAILQDADFRSSLLERVVFNAADLRGADFRSSVFQEMESEHLSGATLSAQSRLPGSIEDYEHAGLLIAEPDFNSRLHSVHFDSKMSPLVRAWVMLDVQKLTELKIDAKESALFSSIFGGSTQEDLISYFFSRISAIVRKDFNDFQLRLAPPLSSTLASNLGTALMFENIYTQRKTGHQRSAKVNGQQITPSPGLNGILMLGPGYTRSETNQSLRLSTLVHEARHTDCPSPPSADQLGPAFEGETPHQDLSELQCGYFHIMCPKGSELEGLRACDNQDDGAYGATRAFAEALDRSCENCTERERARARIVWLEAKNRIFK
jgi:uncharacterized protein YjbI with pentapeptide repeats